MPPDVKQARVDSQTWCREQPELFPHLVSIEVFPFEGIR